MFAEKFIADEFEKVSNLSPSVVVLISPNHFDAGFSKVLTTDRTWKTELGNLESGNYLLPHVDVFDGPFNQEHGIFNIIPFVKKTFPSARIIPLIVKESASTYEIDALARRMHETLPSDTLYVGSFDFSHELPSDVAEFHDRMSLAAIVNRDDESISHLDIDSRAGLRLLVETMGLYGAERFDLGVNSNAARIAEIPWSADNTSYITGRFVTGWGGGAHEKVVTVLIIPTGDVADYEKMPRLLSGQYITAVSGGNILDVDRRAVERVSQDVLGDAWDSLPENTIRLKTFRQGFPVDSLDVSLKMEGGVFNWSDQKK